MSKTIFTNLGIEKIRNATSSNSFVNFKYVAMGDGNGSKYDPMPSMKSLINEKTRVPIRSYNRLDNNAFRIVAEFPENTPNFIQREIGFFDEDGDLIVLNAGIDFKHHQIGGYIYIVENIIAFGQSGENINIIADSDEFYQMLLVFGKVIANLQKIQLEHSEILRRPYV